MKAFLRKPSTVFFLSMLVVAAILFLVPINLFDGEITYHDAQGNYTNEAKLSLSYFIGIGASEADLRDVVNFKLHFEGYLLAGLFLVAFPLLIAYRVKIANQQESRKKRSPKNK